MSVGVGGVPWGPGRTAGRCVLLALSWTVDGRTAQDVWWIVLLFLGFSHRAPIAGFFFALPRCSFGGFLRSAWIFLWHTYSCCCCYLCCCYPCCCCCRRCRRRGIVAYTVLVCVFFASEMAAVQTLGPVCMPGEPPGWGKLFARSDGLCSGLTLRSRCSGSLGWRSRNTEIGFL